MARNKIVFYSVSLLFVAINLALIAYDVYYMAFLPVIFIFVLASLVSLDKVLLAIVFFTPLSIRLDYLIQDIPVNLYLPTEPLLIAVLFLFIFKLMLEGNFDRKIITHPVSVAIFINLLWLLITSITSTMPGVSFKFLLSRVWFVVAMYFVATQVFRKHQNMEKFQWLYIISLGIVVIYTNIRLSAYGFNNQAASNWVVWPFFSDHTSYGAMLVMFLFPLLYFLNRKKKSLLTSVLTSAVFLIFTFGIILSYTRAAWLSLIAAIGLWIVIKLRIKIRYVLLAGLGIILLFFALQQKIMDSLEQNEMESSGKFSEHIESMANITTDASNMERINRWKSAIRMFKEKPMLGWGPGTYTFQYAPFQRSYDRTPISTNFGELGNAHSEYLGALAESGMIGMLSFMLIVFMTFRTGYRVYHQASSREVQVFALYIILGLSTYFIHGILNNFLDTDKASVPVWGFIAMLVALDVYHTKNNSVPED